MKRSRTTAGGFFGSLAGRLLVAALLLLLAGWLNRSALLLNWGYVGINRNLAQFNTAQAADVATQDSQIALANAGAWLARQPFAPAQQDSAARAIALIAATQLSLVDSGGGSGSGGSGSGGSDTPDDPIALPSDGSISALQAIVYGNNDRAAGKYSSALYWYRAAAAQQPDAVGPLYFQAVTHLALGAPAVALPLLQRARALDGYDTTVGRSDVIFQIAQAQSAISADDAAALEALLREALQINQFGDQNPATVYYTLGRLLAPQRRPTEALAAFEQAIAIDPLRYWAHVELGTLVWTGQRDRARAELALTTAIEIRPDEPAAYLLLARIYRQNDEIDAARELYQQVLSFAPQNVDARRGLDNLEAGTE